MLLAAVLLAAAADSPVIVAVPAGEEPVAPYVVSNANAGATPYRDDDLYRAFGGRAGIGRVVDRFVAANIADPRIGDIFRAHDHARLRRTLAEQFCYLLGGGCDYSGRDMASAHKDLGLQTADLNALVDNLQRAMAAEKVPFGAQNRLLAKLAPMKRMVVVR